MHTNVEGQSSGKDILMSLRAFKKEKIDVLVMIRGGGSMQSLSGFDNELLVREIAKYPVPVLAGVGHHQDIPLAALASDLTESTPSMVAVKLNESWDSARLEVKESERTIIEKFNLMLEKTSNFVSNAQTLATEMLDDFFQTYREVQTNIESRILVLQSRVKDKSKQISQLLQPVLSQIERQIRMHKQQTVILPTLLRKVQRNLDGFKAEMARYEKNSLRTFEVNILNCSKDLTDLEKIIKSNNPERQLSLGYSIARSGNKIIRNTSDAQQGDDIDLQVSDGTIKTKVK
jgi:exodeoxyribonuclease VII large subunit